MRRLKVARLAAITVIPLVISSALLVISGGHAEAASIAGQESSAQRIPQCSGACTKIGSFSVPYNHRWTFISGPLRVCAVFDASGSISYTLWRIQARNAVFYSWENQSLNAPKLTLRTYAYVSRRC